MADPDKALREHVHQKPTDEFFSGNGHRALHVAVRIVSATKRDGVAIECDQSMIGDGDTMSITTEITQHLVGATKWRLDVDDPWMPVQLSHEYGEITRCGQVLDQACKPQTFLSEGILQTFNKLATKHFLQHFQ